MAEFIAAIIGGILSLIGTFSAIFLQFKNQKKEKDEEYHNDLVSMIDIITYKAAKVRNNELNFKNANYSKENTIEIYTDIEQDYKSLDYQIQDLITMMSHHIDRSNTAIQELLSYYEPFERQFNKFKVAYKIYNQRYEDEAFDKNAIAFSKIKLDQRIEKFVNNMKKFDKENYNHEIYEPNLNKIIDKNEAINVQKYKKS
ncbi:type I secretion system protein [Staphylococcus warneri]|uniref:type I secretion system protein n=1 Tax=Staphylococcus warneri TaxID=1292 RepID=UPI000E6A5C75|nr:type I secretion system protein [Staphylococcus warneri]RIN00443.1 type I secretion system protein [Staphylococcus warneri]